MVVYSDDQNQRNVQHRRQAPSIPRARVGSELEILRALHVRAVPAVSVPQPLQLRLPTTTTLTIEEAAAVVKDEILQVIHDLVSTES